MPDTKPGVTFNAEGVCSACQAVERKAGVDWEARANALRTLCDSIRGSNGNGYECVVPVSGGKDSTYQTYMMSQVYKLKTLCVIVVPHLQTREGILNLNTLVSHHGVDLLKISVRPSTLKKIRRIALTEIGNPNYAEHRVVFAAVALAAMLNNVPLVVWGEDIAAELGGNVADSAQDGSAEDLINNDLFRERGFDELLAGRIPENELIFYRHPDKEELRRKKIRSIYLGHYHSWDPYENFQTAQKYGFTARSAPLPGNLWTFDNIDEKLCEIHLWFKFLKLGFWSPTDQCCSDIWAGRMTRQEAVELVNAKQYEFPSAYFWEFLEYHQLSEEEFWTVADHFRNQDIWHLVGNEWRLKNELV